MKQESISLNESQERIQANSHQQNQQPQTVSRLNTIIQKNFQRKQQLGMHYSGIIQNAHLKKSMTLNVLYVLKSGQQWDQLGGQSTGISQRARCDQNKIIWNFPFNITYGTRTLTNWPQIYVILYRTDYFGRSIAEAYGNMHLPRSHGKNKRKIRLFKPIQPKSFWSCLNFFSASQLQIKQPQKYLQIDKNKSSLNVEYFGQMNIEVDVKRINFEKHGYQ